MEKKRGDFVMSEEKFEENSTPQDYGAPQDYSAPDTSYSNAGSQAETPVTPVTENGPQTESWQNQGGWQQPQQPEFQNLGSFQNQGNFFGCKLDSFLIGRSNQRHHDCCKGIPFFPGSLRGCGFNQLQLDRVNGFHCWMIHPFVHIPQILS